MSPYTIYVTPQAWSELKDLPGHLRQRIRGIIDAFATNPRPPDSKSLRPPRSFEAGETGGDESAVELWRLRIDRWRIVYTISDADQTVDVLAIRRRPPYDYGDLDALV